MLPTYLSGFLLSCQFHNFNFMKSVLICSNVHVMAEPMMCEHACYILLVMQNLI